MVVASGWLLFPILVTKLLAFLFRSAASSSSLACRFLVCVGVSTTSTSTTVGMAGVAVFVGGVFAGCFGCFFGDIVGATMSLQSFYNKTKTHNTTMASVVGWLFYLLIVKSKTLNTKQLFHAEMPEVP